MYINYDEVSQYLEWLKEKIRLNHNSANAQKRIVLRGEVYECSLGIGVGSEERKKRPCVIIQNNSANKTSSIVLVAPISHASRNSPLVIPITPQIDEFEKVILDGNVLVGNMTSVSKARLGNKISKLSKSEMDAIDQAIIVQTGLSQKFESLHHIIADKEEYISILKSKKD